VIGIGNEEYTCKNEDEYVPRGDNNKCGILVKLPY
jgi:hypothetical protein